jgi:hypothetical protein
MNPKSLKRINAALAMLRFTPEELDFILSYDVKHRLGRDTERNYE